SLPAEYRVRVGTVPHRSPRLTRAVRKRTYNFKLLPHLVATVLFFLACIPASVQVTPSTPTQVTWTFLGPTGSTDRITALVADPRSDSVLYAGTPGGGIWKTQDAGGTWTPLF